MTESRFGPATGEGVYLAIRIGGVVHAVPIGFVEEVLPALPVETIAQLPVFMRGVIFVRGHLIPVLDGAERLGLPSDPHRAEPHLLCLNINGRLIGLEIDEAIDLMELPETGRIPVPELGGNFPFLSAVMDHQGEIVRILDPEKLFNPEEISRLADHVSN